VSCKYYYKDGSVLDYCEISKVLHREDGPAVEWADGYKAWWVNNQLHREDGPACEYADGSKYWYINGKVHRLDGPAIEYANGSKAWYIDGTLHRLDGPACEWANGCSAWWVDGRHLTEEQFNNHPKVQNYRFQVLLEEVLSER
jgi:hypothetical protein